MAGTSVTAAPALGQAQSGPGAPSATPLSIGSVTFTSLECPEEIAFGAGESMVVVTKISGGSRNVQNFGSQPDAISWSGTIWQPNVDIRTETLLAMMVSGAEQLITWRTQKYYGYISKFKPTFRHANRCQYEITVEITRSGNGSYTSTAPPSLDAQVGAYMANAQNAYTTISSADPDNLANAVPQSMLDNITSSITSGTPLAQNVGTQIGTQILGNVTTAIAAVNTYLGMLPALSPLLVPANQLLNSLTLVARNVVQGQTPTSVTTLNQSPYLLAVLNGGTVDNAFGIADANSLVSMRPPSSILQTLTIPPFPTGG